MVYVKGKGKSKSHVIIKQLGHQDQKTQECVHTCVLRQFNACGVVRALPVNEKQDRNTCYYELITPACLRTVTPTPKHPEATPQAKMRAHRLCVHRLNMAQSTCQTPTGAASPEP